MPHGTYPHHPNYRMAWDDDCQMVEIRNSGDSITQYTANERRNANNEDNTTVGQGGSAVRHYAIMFPDQRDIHAFFFANAGNQFGGGSISNFEWSNNTTTGWDGSWTMHQSSGLPRYTNTSPNYRSNIYTFGTPITDVMAIRLRGSAGGIPNRAMTLRAFHLYGEIRDDQPLDHLQVWHPTQSEQIPPDWFDFGDVERELEEIKQFRIRNASTVAQAQDVTVSFESLTSYNPSFVGQHSFSETGTNYWEEINIGALSPGQVSSVLYMKQNVASNAALGPNTGRIRVAASEWS